MKLALSKQLKKVLCILLLALFTQQVVFADDIVLADGCALADAIAAANEDQAVGDCPAGNGNDTIRLTGDIVLQAALPFVDSDITIAGDGYTIDGGGKYHLFVIKRFGSLRIKQLNVINCHSEQGFSPIAGLDRAYITIDDSSFRGNSSSGSGGVIYAHQGNIIIRNSVFEDNSAARYAGAIYNKGPSFRPSEVYGRLEISNVSFKNNRAGAGGAIAIEDGQLWIWDSQFTGNAVEGVGGAIVNNLGRTTIMRSSFTENKAAVGGAIGSTFGSLNISLSSFSDNAASHNGGAMNLLDGEASVSDSSFFNNEAPEGGAVYGYAVPNFVLRHVSMVNNVAEESGGIQSIDGSESAAMLYLHNSVIAGNIGGDCAAAAHENIGSWTGDGSCSAALQGDPLLADMVLEADTASAYMPPLRNSPLIDSADPEYCTETDQLGVARPQGISCDIGAIEFAPPEAEA